jgi:hypothetical protein
MNLVRKGFAFSMKEVFIHSTQHLSKLLGTHGSVVVEALCYKPEGRGIGS